MQKSIIAFVVGTVISAGIIEGQTLAAGEIKAIMASSALNNDQYNVPKRMVDGDGSTMYCVPYVEKFSVKIVYREPVRARWLAIMQAGWINSSVWGQIKSLRVTINGRYRMDVELAERPAEMQAIDLKRDYTVSTLELAAIEKFPRKDTLGGLAEIQLSPTRPKANVEPGQHWAYTWKPAPDHSPTLHTTAMKLKVKFKQKISDDLQIDLASMDQFEGKMFSPLWRAKKRVLDADRVEFELRPTDFVCIDEKSKVKPIRFIYVTQIELAVGGATGSDVEKVSVEWIDDDKTVYPWEKDPPPVGKETSKTFWPGADHNNGGHFAWRYEANGLLINNVSFNCIERSWYYFKPGRKENESFQFNFKIPGAIAPQVTIVQKGDEEKKTGEVINRAGIAKQFEYKVDLGIYAKDKVEADWTSFRWRRNVKTKAGKEYYQELRYGILATGVQVETDAPAFLLSFQDAKLEKGPAGIFIPGKGGNNVLMEGSTIDPADMKENYLVLLANDGTPEVPVMVVFQHRPDRLEWTKNGLIVHRTKGVGTLAIGTPFGAVVLGSDTLAQWTKGTAKISSAQLKRFSQLLTGYPWKCKESFAVAGGWVEIKDTIEFLPWQDDWNTKVQPRSPLPPLVAYSVQRGYLPKECVTKILDMDVVTKWGPYWVREGNEIEYKLPVPRAWDYAGLATQPNEKNLWLYKNIMASLTRAEIEKRFSGAENPNNLGPGNFPHCAAHDFSAGGLRASFYMPEPDRQRLIYLLKRNVLSALYPQNYRLRTDPITKEQHVACTCVGGPDYEVNGEGFGDIDYWQGLVLYGIYTHAKYCAMWEDLEKYWPTIRSLASYWEATHSWALMGPGAREAGELYHGDMPTAGYAGLVGFNKLAQQLGTPYQRDLSAYLLAKAAVPMAAKFGFRDWGIKLSHQETQGGGMCSGFGERFTASFNSVSNQFKNFEPADPWWRTGCIGPQSGQPESIDVFVSRCYKDILHWEEQFRQVCPDEGFLNHDTVRVMPHIMLRTYLGDTMRADATAMLKKYQQVYLLRDAHVATGLLSWEVPVRLIEWSPALIEYAGWDKKAGAKIGIEVKKSPIQVQIAVHSGLKSKELFLDGKPVPAVTLEEWKQWTLFGVTVPAGKHVLTTHGLE